MQKITRKIKEEPLVPLGIGLTVFAFVNAYRALRKGDSQQANRMFRARVLAQGFTVVAMCAGSMYYSKDREKTAELRKLKEAADAEEKRRKWIRELEVRDEEEKALRNMLQKKVNAVEEPFAEDKSQTDGTGGILGKMGLWSQGEKVAKAADDAAAAAVDAATVVADQASPDQRPKRSPKSSLGTLGEIITTQKKDGK